MRAMTLRLPDEVHEALRKEAYESRRSMNNVVLEALESLGGAFEATCQTCGAPSAYRLGMPEPSWCKEHGPYREGSKQ